MSVESSRKIKTSLFIVFLMVSMTWSAGINEIVSKYEPKSELPDAPVVVETSGNVGCDSATRTAGTPIYVDPVVGSNTWAGTSACPKASLEDALSISIAGDEIILNSGLYHENVTVNNKDDLLIRAADGAKVVFDGTRSIAEDYGAVWSAADGDGIQEVDLPQAGWQLFLAYEEQVPARWPNAQFSDETVFNRSYWAEGTLTNSNNAYTQGWLTDAGPETGVHSGLNETINATGLDPVGAIAILNLGSFRSNSREITGWNSANGTFSYDSSGVSWKNKHHAYFLEGKRELIDIDGEWWFDNANSRLHYKTPSGQDANDLDLRVKVQPFAISVDGSDGVTIQGIDFFGTTVNFNNCDGCSFTNATLEYPSTSKRGLGIAGESEDDRWMTRFYRCTNTFVDRISITNTDGGALEFHGSGGQSHNNTVNNSYFHAIDWTAADQKGLMTTIYEGGRDMYFTNNSVHLTGASSVLSIGDAPKVFYNDVWDVGHLQSDGAVVQVMQGEAPGAEIAYNWIHDVIKYGARFDAPIGQAGEGRNGTMHHNVIWNAAGGLMVKGDYHDIHNNTVFNSTGKNDIIFLTDGGINNKNSTLHYNAVDAMADHRSDDIFANPIPYGADWMNWNGYIQGKQDAVTTLHDEINSGGYVRLGNTCIINSTKSLLCWGYNANGQLGVGNTIDQYSPVAVTFPNAGTVEKVAESGGFVSHNCAIMTNGSLYCWGHNSNGELGIGSTTQQTTPQLVNLGSGVKAVDVSVGQDFTCAVTDAGALMCWGDNGYGKLGIGSTSSTSHLTPQNAILPTNRKAVDVTLGRHFAYALLDNGDVVSWGRNHVGYLGTGDTAQRNSPTVVSLDSQRQVVSISAGKQHGCIGYDNGSVVCTGRDIYGQQGRNSAGEANDLTFNYTNALANLSIMALAGQYTSCALLANGTAQCWGYGGNGQMGDGTTGNNHYPDYLVNTPSGRFIVDMSMSGSHACIVLDDGSVACWGNNNRGQLGLGNTTQQNQPVVLTGLDDVSTTSVHEMLVDPANNDFRPKWGSHLHVLNAGAYAADDADPWTAGISWTYTTPSAPVAGCMLDYADNYDADATLSDGSCLFASYSPPSTLDLRLHLDPTNSSSYSGSGTNVADLSGFNNNGTVASVGPDWHADRTRFAFDGSCSNNSAGPFAAGSYTCDEIEIEDSTSLRPGEPYEDLAVELNQGATNQYLKAPATPAGYTLGAVETSFTIQAWVKPTDCEGNIGTPTFVMKHYSFIIGCNSGTWRYILGSGSSWYGGGGSVGNWIDTDVTADDDVWQHVALTRASSSTGVKFFLNGIQSYSVSSYEGNLGDNNAQPLHVGTRQGYVSDDAWHGLIDDVRIYTDDRSSTIADDLNEYPSVNDANLNAFFDFNLERHGDTITSISNMATGSGASSASLTSVTGSPEVVRTWDVSTVGSETVLTFERTVITAQGGWRVPAGVSSARTLIVGGGGGGGYTTAGGGGGGGVEHTSSATLTPGSTMTVIVGQGGKGSTSTTSDGGDGRPSQLGSSIVGGGGGGANWASSGGDGSDAPPGTPTFAQRGSGGGASNGGTGGTGSTNGGSGGTNAGAGGGGAGANGSSISSNAGGNGGFGESSNIKGNTLVMYGSGGGGGGWTGGGSGGSGAGNGGRSYDAGHGTANRGGGGGGGGYTNHRDGGNGGSGVVIVRFASVDHNDWSVATWINASSEDYGVIVGVMNGGAASDMVWSIRREVASPHKLGVAIGDGDTSNSYASPSVSIDEDRWYHVVMVADMGNMLRLYLDGVNVANASLSGVSNLRDSSNSIFIGSFNGGEYNQAFDGQVGSVMIFADTLNATNINQLYTSGKGVYSNTTNLSYSASSYTFTNGQTYSLPISVSAGEVTTSFALTGTLPAGMNFESSNGTIWGTPTADMSSTNYTVTANNSAGSFSTTFSIQIMSAPSGITYSPSSMTLEKGTAMNTNTPTYSGSTVTSWSINPSLPSGLSIDASTGAISGTPSVLQTSSQSYTVTATNSQGSATTSISIIINDQVPVISYTSPVEISNNREMTTATPTNSGGAVTSWEISPSLPTGLSFGSTNGSIWGTPENVTSNATYTVYANNSGGSGTTTVALNIVWTLTPSVDGAFITRNSSIGTDITWEWDYDPLEAGNLTMYASWRNTCAIRDDGDLYCWGRNGNGQLGIGSMGSSHWKDRPTKTNNLGSDAISVSMGEQHTCAVLDTGVLKCWGRNHHGQVGDGTTTDRSSPQTINVGSGRTTTSVYMGFHHTCAILDDQSVKCWGRNQDGELGVGSTTSSFDTPQTINTLGTNRHAISLALGEGFTCALLDDGSIKCWGQDNEGQRGDGGGYGSDIRSPPSSAISLPAGRTATQITAGAFHACALLDDASVVCWGKNHEGQLGDGSTTDRTAPVTTGSFGSGHSPSYISAGYDHTCALLTDGGVRCWGSNNNGQLGDGTSTDRTSPPSSDINLGSGYTAIGISSGGGHTCAMLNDGDMKCWGASGSGQLGDNNGFNGGDQKTPVFVQGSRVWQEGDFLTSPDVSGANCGISPALPTGLSLTTGTCAITGTPTVTALNATYTIWANISGESFSGQVWIEVGLNAPIPSYSPNSYTYTKGTAITPITATNTGGEVVSWDFDSTFPSGLSLGASNGTIWGTPDTITSTTTYTIWANNSAGSASTTITFTVNDVPPSISYSASSLSLLKGAQMSALAVTNSGGAIVSCSVSPALPNGMLLSSTCELSGTPSVAATNASYTITATNTGGSDSTSIYIEVLNSGGTLTVTPTHSTGSVNATLASIAASYSHSLTIPSWASGVTNTSVEINNSASVAGTAIAAWDNGNLAIAWTRPIYGGTTQHVLALSTYDGSSWTTQDIDTASRTGYRPSIAIDNQGALHIAYLDRDNTNLRYATNASGSWVLSTLDTSSVNPNNVAAKTGIAIDNRGHVHIIHPVQGSGVWVLNYTTNVSGSFVSTTITDTTKDDGKYASLAIAGNGSLHISVYRDSGGSDLRYYTDETGVWTNETVHTGNNYGKDSAIALNSKDEVVIVYRKDDAADDIYMSVGNRGSWTSSLVASNRYASYLAVAIDSNDDVHISSHNIRSQFGYCCNKDLEYFTNSSGSWVRKTLESGVGGIFGSIVIDSNDDVHISHADNIGGNDLFYATVKGSGKGLAVNPVFSVSPSLPDGLILNWKTGEITGTPTTASNNTTYTLTALALGATTTTTFTLHVTGAPGEIVYTDILGTKGVAITPVTPIISLNGTTGGISSWAINSTLPTGLNFGTSNGTIWGTPTQVIAGAVFTIWANNSVGSKSTTINITINDAAPVISYSTTEITGTKDVAISPHVGPTTSGGTITSWEISPDPGSAFHFNSNNGYISGTPSILLSRTQYTIWANNSGGSSVAYVNVTINDAAPGPFEYNPENNTWTNNTEVHLAPQFINQTTGNGSTWKVFDINTLSGSGSLPGDRMAILVGDTIYFDANDGSSTGGQELWAYDISNDSTWLVANIYSGSYSSSWPGTYMSVLVGDTIYFSADDGSTGHELWAHDTSNHSTWQVADINSGSGTSYAGSYISMLVGDTLYFSADDGSTGTELWAHDTSNHSTWRVVDINSGATSSSPGLNMEILIGDTLYFDATEGTGSNRELWAHDTSNHSTWQVVDVSPTGNGNVGLHMSTLVGDTIYFSASDGSTGTELWAHDTSNHSTWQAANIAFASGSSFPGLYLELLVGDTIYFSASDGSTGTELWAHDTSNHSTWKAADISSSGGGSTPGQYMGLLIGDTLYFSANDGSTGLELWAHDTSNHSTWQVDDLSSGSGSSNPGNYMGLFIGDTLYFSADDGSTGHELWAHDTSNHSTWQVDDLNSGSYSSSRPGQYMELLVGDTVYFSADDGGSTGTELWAHRPSTIDYNTNTGGNVTTWAINASLPSGVSFGTNNGTIYGTPTELWTQTSYMVWANNSGGSTVAYLNITVVDELPTLSYSPSTLVLTKGNQSSDLPLNATLTGSGTITSWAINATLPAGLNFGTSNGTIWGIPTVLQTTATTYTIWANNSGGSTSATITITINDEAPGPFEYNPENNTWTNNTEVHLAPQFINQTTGNGSTWQVANINSGSASGEPGRYMRIIVGDTLYFSAHDGSTGIEMWAHDTSNRSTWQVADIYSGSGNGQPGVYMAFLVGDTIYFDAIDGITGLELWAHDTSNHTTWQVADINSGSGSSSVGNSLHYLVGDTLYFNADDGSTGRELWAHDTSNGTTWQVADINSGSGQSAPGSNNDILVGDTIYFSANDGSTGNELWAHDTSNHSTWQVADIRSGSGSSIGGDRLIELVGDTLYFCANDGSTSLELWAHDTSNHSTWQVADINSGSGNSNPGLYMHQVVGDTIYFNADDGSTGQELWAHDTSNGSTWRVADINSGSDGSAPGWHYGNRVIHQILAGDTIYFPADDGITGNELWAYDTSNRSLWQVADINSGSGNGDPGSRIFLLIGDTIYFRAYTGQDWTLWAHDTSNHSTWQVTDISSGSNSVYLGYYMRGVVLGDTIYFDADDGSTGQELWAHEPSSINYQTNTGGSVTTWAINASLPAGLSFGTNNGTIYGTPTELWTQTSYMVWANNSGGSSVAYLNITVVDEVPTLSYSPSALVLTINTSSSDLPLNATLTGSGTITSWAISPALPSGLSFGTSNGTIWGTPTSLMTLKTFTIWANNSGGSSSATVNITVNDEAPDISYNPDWFVLTNNTAMSPTATPTNSGGAIPSGILDSNGNVGDHTSIAIDSNGFKHISYLGLRDLKYATDKTGSWVAISVDTTGRVGEYTSIAIDSNGAVHISYYDRVNDDLKYASCSSGCTSASNWDNVSVDTTGNVGLYTSIAIDSNDAVHISYFQDSYANLKYATCSTSCTTASNWDVVFVDTTGIVGYYTSIAIDSNDAIHISYFYGTYEDLKYATCSSGCTTSSNWDLVAVDTTGSVGEYTSIAIDSNDAIHISYHAWYSKYDLKYATCSSGCTTANNWDIVTVDAANSVGRYSSIAIDSNDAVHISYYNATNSDLKYATCSSGCTTASNWDDVSVDTTGNVGLYTSIAIDSNDAAHISYYDSTNIDLKYVVLGSSSNIYGYSISPDLPAGLNFNAFTGEISGTPTELLANTTFTITARNSGGVNTTTITIEVIDQLPGLSYSPENLTLTNNTASPNLPLVPTITGPGAITSWALNNTSLPTGISFNTSTGTFSGTPTELWPTQAYMVWANNSGGSSVAYLNITVVDELPTIAYSPTDITLTNNTASTDLPLIPTLTGAGEITSWAINASLPAGLTFETSNGTIWGTPTELWNTTAYTVWANNTGGSVSTTVTITVIDQVPNTIVYPEINLNLTNNTASPDLPMIPQITGPGAIISWEISGVLPQGLSFDSNTGIISGIATELWSKTNYTVWANNTGGSVSIEFNITVVDQLPTTFTYNPSDLLLSNNTASSDLPLTPQLAGPGLITSWAINETLPSGLQFGTNNGTIWGIPTEIQLTPKPFNITASNSGGTVYAIINITIVEAAPTLDYDPDNYTFIRNTTITDIVPIYTPLDLIDTWEINPALPNGLTLDNGTISGTPTVNMTITEFTVWANNTGGSASANINITIVEPTGSFAYIPDDVNLTRGQGISPMSPNYNGGAIENWSIHPQLPAGLVFDNGTISGTPTVNSTKVNYTVYANNSGGSVTAFISITINEPVASIIYVPDERNETRTISMTPWFPQVTGGEVETWEIYPALPNGLTFADGIISGTATVNSTRTTYTVWANNTGGSASTMINLTVVEPVVQLSYPNYELILVRDTTMTSLMPQLSGGEAETWEIYPELPAGINFTDGMIWGTPAVNSTRTMYTVYANNTGGSTNVSLNITILEPSANIVYDPVNLILTRGEAMEPAIPDTDGGAIEEWGIHPELPDGLIFDNGTIYGTPTVNMTTTNYIIYGNNSGGSSIAGLSITVLEPAPTITYLTDYLVLTRGEAMTSPLHAIFGGGAVASFTVTPDLPDGLNFTNGTIFGTPTVNSTIVEYNISAINNGGSDYFLLNITILEPVANLSTEQNYFELIRGEDEMNLTLNNTGGMVATWEIAPELPAGLIFGNGTITGTPAVNASLATYTIWANNTGGSDSILVNIRVLEPAANISYRKSDFTLINGQDNLYIAPDLLGGNPETWEFEPELPAGITFSNGVFSGVPKDNLTTTTFTVWANNSGGSATATITLTVDQPFFVVRYPMTILVLNVSEDMPVLAPVYYFDETSNPVWSVEPALPDGLIFDNGNISGIPTTPQPLTSYNVTVTGDLVPFTFEIMIEIREAYVDPVIEDQRNETQMEAEPPETEFPEPEEDNIAFWLCPLILIILLFLTAMLYNAKKNNDDVEIAED